MQVGSSGQARGLESGRQAIRLPGGSNCCVCDDLTGNGSFRFWNSMTNHCCSLGVRMERLLR